MGKKLDALLGRGLKTNKFKATINLAISRLSVLRNQHKARCSVARSDVVQILNLGHHERALFRVEEVVKEQNMLDVYTMVEIYCYLLIQRVSLLEHAKECPEELKEAISSLIYACSRCGEFPELREIRAIFTSRFGKDFVSRALQLRNNCGVNPKIIQKLSTRMPSTESRLKVLKEIALENNIVLQIQEPETVQSEVKNDEEKKEDGAMANKSNGFGGYEVNSMKMRGKYNNVGQAAQAAFESAAYAATAARAAVELSRANSHDPDSPRTPNLRIPKLAYSPEIINSRPEELMKKNEKGLLFERSVSNSSIDSENNTMEKIEQPSDEEEVMPQTTKVMFDDSDSDTEDHVTEFALQSNEVTISSEKDYSSDMVLKSNPGYIISELKIQEQDSKKPKMHNLSINRAPVSVRTRRTYFR